MNGRAIALILAASTVAAAFTLAAVSTRPLRAPELRTAEAVAAPVPEPAHATPALQTETLPIRRNDTLIAALARHDVPAATARELADALRAAGANLRQIRAGDRLELQRDGGGRPVALLLAPGPWVQFRVVDTGETWHAERTAIEPEVRVEVRQGKVERSLWDAVERGAVAPSVLLELVRIFESEFDFTADTQPGDEFRLLVETRYANGAEVDHGRIVAAQYASADRVLTGIGFDHGGRFAHYDLEGRSLKKTFLRSPLQFSRISSGFTYRRPHPILGGVRPHLAIDYAAPSGTPVWAVADGTVAFAGRNRGNGIQVRLQHRGGYATTYNHLSRVADGVKRGARVTQKQVIGYVGSTGLSTGPHLDYRVSHRGTFVNPLSEKFLPGEPIPVARRVEFDDRSRALLSRLQTEAPFGI